MAWDIESDMGTSGKIEEEGEGGQEEETEGESDRRQRDRDGERGSESQRPQEGRGAGSSEQRGAPPLSLSLRARADFSSALETESGLREGRKKRVARPSTGDTPGVLTEERVECQ